MNKFFDHPAKIASWVTIISMFSIFSYTAIDTRNTAAENKTEIKVMGDILKEQQIMNKYYYRQEQQQTYYPQKPAYPNQPTYQEPPKRCWDWDKVNQYEREYECSSGYWL